MSILLSPFLATQLATHRVQPYELKELEQQQTNGIDLVISPTTSNQEHRFLSQQNNTVAQISQPVSPEDSVRPITISQQAKKPLSQVVDSEPKTFASESLPKTQLISEEAKTESSSPETQNLKPSSTQVMLSSSIKTIESPISVTSSVSEEAEKIQTPIVTPAFKPTEQPSQPNESLQVSGSEPVDLPLASTAIQSQTLISQLPGDVLQVPQSTTPSTPAKESNENPLAQKTVDQRILLEALSATAAKYSWIINPSDGLSFDFTTFQPNKVNVYINSSLRVADNNPSVKKLGFGYFPKNRQFYWLLDNNRIVIETDGIQGGVLYQGQTTELQYQQTATYLETFLGSQFIVTLPPVFGDLVGEAETGGNFSVRSSAVQVINPIGKPAGEIAIDQSIDYDAPNVKIINLSAGGNGVNGAGSLFTNLEATNTPQILQSFPTVNLQPLLTGSSNGLQVGSVISSGALEAAGIIFGDPLTGEGFEFNAPITSTPGIKLGQGVKPNQNNSFERLHQDLLNLAIDPSISPEEKDFHYLNSLNWTPIFRPADIELNLVKETKEDWYRAYLSKSHQRTVLQYDPEKIHATYTNIFSNPGISVTSNLKGNVDLSQSINSSIGMLLGGAFEWVNLGNLNSSIKDARTQYQQEKGFTPLKTKATPQERRLINLRLNETLNNALRASNLEQVSGSISLPSKIKPDSSQLFQIQTGNYNRRVEFSQIQAEEFEEGNTVLSQLRLSNQDFGPLGFVGGIIPLNQTSITPINESFAVETILTDGEGQQFVQRFNSSDNTVIPLSSGRAFGLALDKIDLRRVDERTITQDLFVGNVSLPAVEVVMAGTSGKLNYGISAGTWLNLSSSTAPGVAKNTDGLKEPDIGVYTHATLNWVDSQVKLNDKKEVTSIITHTPFIDLNWTSAANRLNSAYLTAGYSLRYQGDKIGFTLAPAFSYIPSGINNFFPGQSNGEILGFFNGEIGIKDGVTLKTSFEIGKDTFYNFELSRNINQHLTLGGYIRNSTTINPGLESRVSDLNYGGILSYRSGRMSIDAQLGAGNNGLDARMNLGINF